MRRFVRKNLSPKKIHAFQRTVWTFFKKHRRDFPWRKTKNPYRILVSEIMLQQTQVDRVIPKYNSFLKKFPTVKRLASTSLVSVLRLWQGLGYNRRAKMLHDAAKIIVARHGGAVPRSYSELVALPGVGDYTAKAVRVFAFNEPEILIETNIRSVYLHHFFPRARNISDSKILSYMIRFPISKNSRKWYSALMDYGAYLKKTLPNPSRRSAHHSRQKPFKGSDREIRGAILRRALSGKSETALLKTLPFPKLRLREQLTKLKAEGLI